MLQYSFSSDKQTVTIKNVSNTILTGVLTSSNWNLTKWNVHGNDQAGWSGYDKNDIYRYYNVLDTFAGARFIVFKDGRTEYTLFGSGRPIIDSINGANINDIQ